MHIEIEDAVQLSDEKRRLYLKRKRDKCKHSRSHDEDFELASLQSNLFHLNSLIDRDQETASAVSIMVDDSYDKNDSTCFSACEEIERLDKVNSAENGFISYSSLSSNDLTVEDEPTKRIELLHPFTGIETRSFCYRILHLFRESGLSKAGHRKFLDLIHTVLPIPNNLPVNMDNLLSILEIKNNIFRKKKICFLCRNIIENDKRFCQRCQTCSEKDIVIIYESDIKYIVSLLLKKFWKKTAGYRQQLRDNNDSSGTNDIGFGLAYQSLLHQYPDEVFITALMHLDGIPLCKSSKLKLWLCSFSLVELPAKIRYQRYNMPVVSIWIGHKEPVVSLWLQNGVATLEELKVSGIVLNDQVIKLKVLAITGDLPALKIALKEEWR